MSSANVNNRRQLVFAALSDPTRRSILLNLAQHSPRTATQLAREFPITRQGIYKHLTVLQDAGLVSFHQKGREVRYTLTPAPLDDVEHWLKKIGAVWDKRLLRLKNMLEEEQN